MKQTSPMGMTQHFGQDTHTNFYTSTHLEGLLTLLSLVVSLLKLVLKLMVEEGTRKFW
jgi:hypothetical protein